MREAYIFDALRTPLGLGVPGGALYEVKPVDLLAAVLRALLRRNDLAPGEVEDLIIGCVTPVGDQGFNLARAAQLHAGWPFTGTGMQVNRFCASGLEAVHLAAMKIRSGWEELVVAGGVESMSRIPFGSEGGALRYDPELIGRVSTIPQGVAADLLATREGFSREMLDAWALRSQQRARHAIQEGYFRRAMIPIHDRNGLLILDRDECLRPENDAAALAALPPAFAPEGSLGFDEMSLRHFPGLEGVQHIHSEGNSGVPADGAALVLIGSREKGAALGLRPRARILAAGSLGVRPSAMFDGAGQVARKVLASAGMTPADVDLWECNEAFAAVPLAFRRGLNIDEERLNVNGGAIAQGNPHGATGAILLGTLLDELERRSLGTGLVVIPTAAGMALATIIERVDA